MSGRHPLSAAQCLVPAAPAVRPALCSLSSGRTPCRSAAFLQGRQDRGASGLLRQCGNRRSIRSEKEPCRNDVSHRRSDKHSRMRRGSAAHHGLQNAADAVRDRGLHEKMPRGIHARRRCARSRLYARIARRRPSAHGHDNRSIPSGQIKIPPQGGFFRFPIKSVY